MTKWRENYLFIQIKYFQDFFFNLDLSLTTEQISTKYVNQKLCKSNKENLRGKNIPCGTPMYHLLLSAPQPYEEKVPLEISV